VQYQYTRWHNKKQTKIVATCSVFKETFVVDHLFVKKYGAQLTPAEGSVIIDEQMVKQYPMLLPTTTAST
jgi:hypothetical protein